MTEKRYGRRSAGSVFEASLRGSAVVACPVGAGRWRPALVVRSATGKTACLVSATGCRRSVWDRQAWGRWRFRAAIIVLRGEHDLATVPLVEDALARARFAGPVVVDLTDAAFIDSSIISVLSRPADSGLARSQLAVVVPPEGVVRRILLLLSIDQV